MSGWEPPQIDGILEVRLVCAASLAHNAASAAISMPCRRRLGLIDRGMGRFMDTPRNIPITLTRAEALVLFEFLSRENERMKQN